MPDPETQPVIVHGDIGPGNFLIHEGRVRALVDWEMVRVGHPLEDLACIIARGLGADFGKAQDHIHHYQLLTGTIVDRRKLDYALALVITRWTIAISMALSRPSAAQNIPMLFAFRQINSRALIDVFCRYYELAEFGETPVSAENRSVRAVTTYCSETLTQFADNPDLVGAVRYKIAGINDLISYLKSVIEYGPETYESEETLRIARLVAPGEDPRQAICDYATVADLTNAKPLVEFLRWRTMREHGIMRTSLGVRADNIIAY